MKLSFFLLSFLVFNSFCYSSEGEPLNVFVNELCGVSNNYEEDMFNDFNDGDFLFGGFVRWKYSLNDNKLINECSQVEGNSIREAIKNVCDYYSNSRTRYGTINEQRLASCLGAGIIIAKRMEEEGKIENAGYALMASKQQSACKPLTSPKNYTTDSPDQALRRYTNCLKDLLLF